MIQSSALSNLSAFYCGALIIGSYMIIIICGIKIHIYVKQNLNSNVNKKAFQLNQQITLTLFLQAIHALISVFIKLKFCLGHFAAHRMPRTNISNSFNNLQIINAPFNTYSQNFAVVLDASS